MVFRYNNKKFFYVHSSRAPQSKASIDKMLAREWLHANHKRLVTVKFGPEAGIHTVDRKGQKLRTFNLKSVDGITVEKTAVALKAIKTSIFIIIHMHKIMSRFFLLGIKYA